ALVFGNSENTPIIFAVTPHSGREEGANGGTSQAAPIHTMNPRGPVGCTEDDLSVHTVGSIGARGRTADADVSIARVTGADPSQHSDHTPRTAGTPGHANRIPCVVRIDSFDDLAGSDVGRDPDLFGEVPNEDRRSISRPNAGAPNLVLVRAGIG